MYLCQSVSFIHSSIGRKASHHHTVRERKNGKRTPVQDQLLMMPVKLVKGKAPISRIEWTYLGINPKLGVVGLVAMILMIYRSRSTNPMRGVLHLHPRRRTNHQISGGDYFTPQSSRRHNHGYASPNSNYSPSAKKHGFSSSRFAARNTHVRFGRS